jgi:hypothetical protein
MSETEALGISRLSFGLARVEPTEAERRVAAGMDQLITDIIRDNRTGPNDFGPVDKVTPYGAQKVVPGMPLTTGRGRSWYDPPPLALPPGQDHIAALCDAMLGPAAPAKK